MSKAASDNPLSEPMLNPAIKTPMVKEPLKLDLPEDAPKWAIDEPRLPWQRQHQLGMRLVN